MHTLTHREVIIKNDIQQLLLKYKHGNNIPIWTRKTANRMNHMTLFLTCHEDETEELQINMLFIKTYTFITRGKI